MKPFAERNFVLMGTIGVLATAVLVVGALNYNKLPFVSSGKTYSAYFDEAGGLTTGAPVRVSGAPAGQVESITLDGEWVLVEFTVADGIRLGTAARRRSRRPVCLAIRSLISLPAARGHSPAPSLSSGRPHRINCRTPSETLRLPSAGSTPSNCQHR